MNASQPTLETQKFGNVSEIQQNETVGFLDLGEQEMMFGSIQPDVMKIPKNHVENQMVENVDDYS